MRWNWNTIYWSVVGGIVFIEFCSAIDNIVLKTGVAIVGLVTGWLFQKSLLGRITNYFRRMPSREMIFKSLGLLFGLAIGALLTSIIRPLLDSYSPSRSISFFGAILLPIIGISMVVFSAKCKEINGLLVNPLPNQKNKLGSSSNQFKIVDTSAIIDGRIADLCKTGFLEGILIVPNFVIGELQKIADSADSLRRNRGRRGLDLLNRMQKESQITIKVFDRDYEEVYEVDTKILKLAREMEAKVITNDYNLNKVAELYGVQVLNINDLSNAIKPLVLPGEEMVVHVLRDGKEYGQGIGYLEDGTMIVVEGGKSYIGVDLEILVTSVLQTSAGRMIFAKPKEIYMSKVTS